MINPYLLTKEEVEALVISLDRYYRLSFSDVGETSGACNYDATEVAKKMSKLLAKGNVFDVDDYDFVMLLRANGNGLVKFCKYFDVIFDYPGTLSSKVIDYVVKHRRYIEDEPKDVKLGSGNVKSKSWGYHLKPFILDASIFDKKGEGSGVRGRYERLIYEMILDYIYFCFVNRDIVASKDANYEGIEIVEGFDISIAKMFLAFYDDDMGGNVVKLVSGDKSESGGSFELFKNGIREYSRETRGYLVEEFVRTFDFQKEFIRANWYGIQQMLTLDYSIGCREEKFLMDLFFGNAKNASEDKRGRVLATIVRFVDYALSGCYI